MKVYSIVDKHYCHIAIDFAVSMNENQDEIPNLYWLPKLHKNIKSTFHC